MEFNNVMSMSAFPSYIT